MYIVLDIPKMMKVKGHSRTRRKPITGFNSTILLKPGSRIDLIPPGSELRYSDSAKCWEVHTPLSNKKIVEKIAKELDAIAFLC